MELPFAVGEEDSNNDPFDSSTNNNHNRISSSSKTSNNNNNNNNNNHGSSPPPISTILNISSSSLSSPSSNLQQVTTSSSIPLGGNGNNSGQRTNSTTSIHSSSSNSHNPTANLLHKVALYDNVHTEHFYTPQQHQQQQQQSSYSSSKSLSNQGFIMSNNLTPLHDIAESTFVTIRESDANGDYDGNMNNNNNDGDYIEYQSVNNNTYNNQFHHDSAEDFVSIGLDSYKEKYVDLMKNNNQTQQGQQDEKSFDVLSLLISSCCDEKNDDDDDNNNNNNNNNTNSHHTNFVQTCEEASKAASLASQLTQKGDIPNAITQHLHSAKQYKDAALYLKTNHHGSDGHLTLLSYSLLVLSNVQSKTANALIQCSGGSSNNVDVNGTGGSGTGGVDFVGRSLRNENREVHSRKDSSSGLRAKIRASMNKAEADMTESTFLEKGVGHSTAPSSSSSSSNPTILNRSTSSSSPSKRNNESKEEDKATINNKNNNSNVNPVDDMMELEKELRDMDMTLEMGVGLSSSSSINNNNNNYGMNSICVVPTGSSYMSSSMMWSSGIGGRATSQQQQQQQQQSQAQNRSRANRVQNMLPAQGASQTIIAPAPKQQQQPTSLETSWWGQASALASSTTSLSNSMVGVRSPNNLTNHPMHGGMMMMDNASTAPANTKQLMRLLDSLKTLGEENASLMREVEEAHKARLEAKAAREAMKQFKEEYSKRFGTLKSALEKFRNEYPDKGGSSGNGNSTGDHNIVTKSDFVKTNEKMEMQKRDQLIKKLTEDLKKEKSDSKKKDDALRKYENFYREVKARSAQKAKQREEEQRRKNMQRK